MKGAHCDYRGRAAKANAPRPFFLALSAILLAAEFVFMQELCAVALDVENAVVVLVVALGATAATPILMNLAAGCFSDYAARRAASEYERVLDEALEAAVGVLENR